MSLSETSAAHHSLYALNLVLSTLSKKVSYFFSFEEAGPIFFTDEIGAVPMET